MEKEKEKKREKTGKLIIACLCGVLLLWLICVYVGVYSFLHNVGWCKAMLIIYAPFLITTIITDVVFIKFNLGKDADDNSGGITMCVGIIYTIIAIIITLISGIFDGVITSTFANFATAVAVFFISAIIAGIIDPSSPSTEKQKKEADYIANQAKNLAEKAMQKVNIAQEKADAAGNTRLISEQVNDAEKEAENVMKYVAEAIKSATKAAATKKSSKADTLLVEAKSHLDNARFAAQGIQNAVYWIGEGENAIKAERKREAQAAEEQRRIKEEQRRIEEEQRRIEEERTTCKQCGKKYDPYFQWAQPPFCSAMCRAKYNAYH